MSRYARLVADPADRARAVDVDALLVAVCAALALTPEQTGRVLTALGEQPVTIEVRSGAEITAALARIRGACPGEARGLCLSARRVWVIRLDYTGLMAHELTHVVQRLLGRPPDEHEAARVADAVG